MTMHSRRQPRTLDWRPRHDPRSRDYPIRSVIGEVGDALPNLWRPGAVLDQGSEGACVGFGWTAELLASPRRSETKVHPATGNTYALAIYARAKVIDEFPGEAYSGTSVLAGAKAVVERGLIDSYRWCFGFDDVRDSLIAEGPVVIGIPWYESMYETALDGEVIVGGKRVGGHCIVLTGYHPEHPSYQGREMVRWRNSWGTSYGLRGSGWIEADALSDLLADDGEACVPLGRHVVNLTL